VWGARAAKANRNARGAERLPSLAFALVALAIPACSSSSDSPPPPPDPGDASTDDSSQDDSAVEGAVDGGDAGDAAVKVATCASGTKTGAAANLDGLRTAGGLTYNVRIPPKYSATVGSPLVVVYAELGPGAAFDEMDTGLTPVAFAHGYIIAYADHDDNSRSSQVDAASIFTDIPKKWCVDPKRLYATGNSDGGLLSFEVAADQLAPLAAIAPSAAGIDGFLPTDPCPADGHFSAFVMATPSSDSFPVQYGIDQAAYFARCAKCGSAPGPAGSYGCVTYPNCTAGTSVVFCEGNQPHATWPGNAVCPSKADCLNEPIFEFFDAHRLP